MGRNYPLVIDDHIIGNLRLTSSDTLHCDKWRRNPYSHDLFISHFNIFWLVPTHSQCCTANQICSFKKRTRGFPCKFIWKKRWTGPTIHALSTMNAGCQVIVYSFIFPTFSRFCYISYICLRNKSWILYFEWKFHINMTNRGYTRY
jgi:hypothetical protein